MSDTDIASLPETRSQTRQERVQRKEDLIISAARAIFEDRGFKGATMAQIARASNVADGTLYTYFQSKEALARAVITDFYGRLTQSAQEGVDTANTMKERLTFLARHHVVNVIEERGILAMMPLIDMNLETYGGSELFGLNKNYVAIFDRVIKDGQERGEIKRGMSLWVLRDIFFGGLDYGSRTMLVKDREQALDLFVSELIDLFISEEPKKPARPLDNAVKRLEKAALRMEVLLKENGT